MQMNRQTSWLLTIFILLTTISFLDAQNLPEIAIGSRSFSLGQVATMSNTDVLNSINNPAALSKNNAYGFSLFYSRPIENTYNPSLGFYLPFYDFGTVSFSYFYYKMDRIPYWDINGIQDGYFSYNVDEYVISYANDFFNRFIYGINSKWMNEKFVHVNEEYGNTDHLSIDLALGFYPGLNVAGLRGLIVGITFKNLLQLNDKDVSVPREFRFIAENKSLFGNHKFTTILNVNSYESLTSGYLERMYVGLEYSYKMIALRAGYNNSLNYNDDRFFFGAGVNILFFSLDYGYGRYSENDLFYDPQHNFTLSFEL
jgi:hypothetical protein